MLYYVIYEHIYIDILLATSKCLCMYFELIWQFGKDQDNLEECEEEEGERASVKALIKTKQADAAVPNF